MSEVKKLSKRDHAELFCKGDNEGFGYYMLQYGPDMDAIEKLGFDLDKVEEAIDLFNQIETAI